MRHRRASTTFLVDSLVMILLGLGFLIPCILLMVHVRDEPNPSAGVIGELLLVSVLSLEGIVAIRHLRQSQRDSMHVLFKMLDDARSTEMMLAVVLLWRFRNEHGDQFVQVYLETWRKDEERIAGLPGEEQLEAMRATLHYRRRVVKEFYNLLAGMYELNVLPGNIIYTYWSDAELRIIPEILIPLETAVARELRIETKVGGWLQRMQRLYDDRPV